MEQHNSNQYFSARLAKLRIRKKISARKMSIDLSQSPGYINKIENQKALPSMAAFFEICDYLKVAPEEFFEDEPRL